MALALIVRKAVSRLLTLLLPKGLGVAWLPLLAMGHYLLRQTQTRAFRATRSAEHFRQLTFLFARELLQLNAVPRTPFAACQLFQWLPPNDAAKRMHFSCADYANTMRSPRRPASRHASRLRVLFLLHGTIPRARRHCPLGSRSDWNRGGRKMVGR